MDNIELFLDELYEKFDIDNQPASYGPYFAMLYGRIRNHETLCVYDDNKVFINFLQSKFDDDSWLWKYVEIRPFQLNRPVWGEVSKSQGA